MTKRIMITLTDAQYEMLKRFKGIMGNKDAEIVKNIVLAYWSEKSYIKDNLEGGK